MGEVDETITIHDSKIAKLRSELRQAIQFNKESLFRKIIDDSNASSCRSALESYDPESHMSPFELACSEAKRAHFIRECIAIGCDTNRQNPRCGRRPVSFAIERFHHDNLDALLGDTSVCVDVEHSFGYRFTPINYLLKQMSDELYEFKENCKCIELLAQHGADVNVPGKDGQTPIRHIVERKNLNAMRKGILIQCIFDYAKYVDVNDENGTLRRQVIELIPDLKLPTPSERDVYNKRRPKDFAGNETEFWQYFRWNKDHLLESYWHSALDYAVRGGLTYSVERILRSGFISTMHSLDECKEPLLTSSLRHIGWTDDANVEKCLNIFLNHRSIDVNAKDKFGYTALSSCTKSVQANVTRKLLECGAYIGMESKWGDLAISDIRPQLLEKHFDSCITTDARNINDESLELTFDYKNLIPLPSKTTSPDHSTKFCEMKAIECIFETCTLRHLVKHPLIESFLDLKWNRLAFIFYTNFFFCTVFALLNIFHIFVFFLDDIEPNVSLTMCLMMLLCLMVARETIQLLASPCAYLKRFQNYSDCTLIGLIMFIVCGNCAMAWRGTVAAVTILLIAYEFSVLVGSLPVRSFAMHYVMLETVATNFFKYLLFYSTIIAAFALAFCCLFHKLPSAANARNISNNNNETDYNNFQSVGLSMLKSIVMANGELDTASIEFDDNVLSYIVFVAFILLVTTVLGNLLSGLAVSDINEVRSQAQWTHLIRRCRLLARYEKSFRDKSSWLIWFPRLTRLIRSIICLYPDLKLKYQKKVSPNKRKERNIRKMVANWLRYMKRVLCFDSHHQIDGDIIKAALHRVKQHLNDEEGSSGIDDVLRSEISKIAHTNDSIQHRIDSIEKTMKSMEKMLEFQKSVKLN